MKHLLPMLEIRLMSLAVLANGVSNMLIWKISIFWSLRSCRHSFPKVAKKWQFPQTRGNSNYPIGNSVQRYQTCEHELVRRPVMRKRFILSVSQFPKFAEIAVRALVERDQKSSLEKKIKCCRKRKEYFLWRLLISVRFTQPCSKVCATHILVMGSVLGLKHTTIPVVLKYQFCN